MSILTINWVKLFIDLTKAYIFNDIRNTNHIIDFNFIVVIDCKQRINRYGEIKIL